MIDPENLDPYGAQNHPLPPMLDEEQKRKLQFIARLTAEELRGWVWTIKRFDRKHFPGEQAALMQRAKELEVTI